MWSGGPQERAHSTGFHLSLGACAAHDGTFAQLSVSAPEPVLLKFAKTIYESPLILLLCGSALVSAFMGNIDDAVSITVAVLIVLTGAYTTNVIA